MATSTGWSLWDILPTASLVSYAKSLNGTETTSCPFLTLTGVELGGLDSGLGNYAGLFPNKVGSAAGACSAISGILGSPDDRYIVGMMAWDSSLRSGLSPELEDLLSSTHMAACAAISPCSNQPYSFGFDGLSVNMTIMPIPPISLELDPTSVSLARSAAESDLLAVTLDRLWDYSSGSGKGTWGSEQFPCHMIVRGRAYGDLDFIAQSEMRVASLTSSASGQMQVAINADPGNDGVSGLDYALAITLNRGPQLTVLDVITIDLSDDPNAFVNIRWLSDADGNYTFQMTAGQAHEYQSLVSQLPLIGDRLNAMYDISGNATLAMFANNDGLAIRLNVQGSIQPLANMGFLPPVNGRLGVVLFFHAGGDFKLSLVINNRVYCLDTVWRGKGTIHGPLSCPEGYTGFGPVCVIQNPC